MLILEQLAVNAVEGARFGDAAFFYTRLAQVRTQPHARQNALHSTVR